MPIHTHVRKVHCVRRALVHARDEALAPQLANMVELPEDDFRWKVDLARVIHSKDRTAFTPLERQVDLDGRSHVWKISVGMPVYDTFIYVLGHLAILRWK